MDAKGFVMVADGTQSIGELAAGFDDGCFVFLFGGERNDDEVIGGDAWWEDEAVVVAVSHDEGADESGGDAP